MVQKSALMSCLYGFHSFPEPVQIFVGVYVLVNVLASMPHEFVPCHTVYPGIVQKHVEGVAAVMGGMLPLDAAGAQGGIKAFPVPLLGDCSGSVMVDQALELPLHPAAYYFMDCRVDGDRPVAAVALLYSASAIPADTLSG